MRSIVPVILSGGSGTRLWPASRATNPKQLLPMTGPETMLQQTLARLDDETLAVSDPMVICNEAHRFDVETQLRNTGRRATLVLEPVGRSTAPAAALAALIARQEAGGDESLLLIMPADHVIHDTVSFTRAVEVGAGVADEGKLVCFGIVPTHPATGYGYIECEAAHGEAAPILSFVEKPDKASAVHLLETNRYFWNAGIFLLRADAWLEELERLSPNILAAVEKSIAEGSSEPGLVRPDGDAFAACPSDSIDYAVMEHTERGMMVPLDAGWSDVGSWSAVHDVSDKDEQGNSIDGDVLAVDCENSFIRGHSRLVAALGVSDLVIVEDKDVVFVAELGRSEGVKHLVDELNRMGRSETQVHRDQNEPWGRREEVDADEKSALTRLRFPPGAESYSSERSGFARHWLCVRGTASVTVNGNATELRVGDALDIAAADAFYLSNPGDTELCIVEVTIGDGAAGDEKTS